MRLTFVLAFGLICSSGCAAPSGSEGSSKQQSEQRPTVKLGDEWAGAEERLLAAGAQPTQLAAMGDAHFELPDGRALIVVLAEGKVSELELVEGLERPKSERRSTRVEELRL